MNRGLRTAASALPHLRTVVVLALAIALGGPVPALAQEASGPEYVVQPGDSLYSIALAFGTSVEALQEANALDDPSLLAVGARLLIPGYEGVSGLLATHALEVGDTLASLSYRLGDDRETLVRLNHIVNPVALYVGQSIVYSAPAEEVEAAPETSGRFVIVRSGETLGALASRYGAPVSELVQLNNLPGAAQVCAGRKLFVPTSDAPLTGLASPIRSLELLPPHPVQGEAVVVVAHLDGPADLTGTLGDWSLHFVEDGDARVALQGIHAFTDPGVYPLTIRVALPGGEQSGLELQVPIASGDYEYQSIALPPDQSALLDPDVVNAEFARIAEVASVVTPTKHWSGAFVIPVNSDRITAGFGLRRSYNGGPFNSFHGGVDLGGPSTTPIVAAAAGEVVLAERLQIRGNATVIDHGWGVYTGYWHQSEQLVSVGQQVAAGEQIGFIGSTGLSTGNHLHWEVWVGGVQVNPLAWVALGFP